MWKSTSASGAPDNSSSRGRQAGRGTVVEEEGVDGAGEILDDDRRGFPGAARRQRRRGDGTKQALRYRFRHLPAIFRLSELRNLTPVTLAGERSRWMSAKRAPPLYPGRIKPSLDLA